MLTDKLNTFGNPVNVFGAAATTKVGTAIDLTVAPVDQGEGYPLWFWAVISTAQTGGTSIEIQLVTADNEALSTNPEVIYTTGAIAAASFLARSIIASVALPKRNYRRWLGIRSVTVGTSTAGAIKAFLVQDPPNWRAYPEGNN
jgi:hypothetical protein